MKMETPTLLLRGIVITLPITLAVILIGHYIYKSTAPDLVGYLVVGAAYVYSVFGGFVLHSTCES